MKRLWLNIVIAWLCGGIGVGFDAFGCEIKFRVQTYPPFSMENSQGQWHGLDIDYADALVQQSGCTLVPVKAPWGRGLELLKKGDIDLMVNVTKNPERAQHYYFFGPQRIERIRLFGIKGASQSIDSWDKLANSKLTYMRQIGAYFGERFENLMTKKGGGFQGKLIELPDNQIRMQLLQRRRVAGFFTEELYADYTRLGMENPSLLHKHPLVIHQQPVYYAFSKASISKAQIAKIRLAYQALAASNKLNQLSDKYRLQ